MNLDDLTNLYINKIIKPKILKKRKEKPKCITVKQYNDDYYRLQAYTDINPAYPLPHDRAERGTCTDDALREQYQYSAAARAKRTIRDYVLCNDFSYFFTLTVNGEKHDRYNLEAIVKEIKKGLKNLRRRCFFYDVKMNYIIINEQHKDRSLSFSWGYRLA